MTINSPMKLMKHFNKIARMDRSKAYVNMQKAYTNGKVEAGLFSTSSSMKKTDKKIEKSNIFLDKNMLEAERGNGSVTHQDIFYHSNKCLKKPRFINIIAITAAIKMATIASMPITLSFLEISLLEVFLFSFLLFLLLSLIIVRHYKTKIIFWPYEDYLINP